MPEPEPAPAGEAARGGAGASAEGGAGAGGAGFAWAGHSGTEAEMNEFLLRKLDPGYLTADFDPVDHVLMGLPAGVGDAGASGKGGHYLEDRAGEQTLRHEMVCQMLYQHVMKNYAVFVEGLRQVADVGDQLGSTLSLARRSRQDLHKLRADVQMGLNVAASARRKQNLLLLRERLLELQSLPELAARIERLAADQCYSRAVEVFMGGYETLGGLTELACCVDMRLGMEELGQSIVGQMDENLQGICGGFGPEVVGLYEEIAKGYLGLGDRVGLGEKVQACFSQAVLQQSHSVVQSYAMQSDPQVGSGALKNRALSELCASLQPGVFLECLVRTMDVVFDIFVSFERMCAWHRRVSVKAVDGGCTEGGGLQEVYASALQALESCRSMVWEHAARRVASLLASPPAAANDPAAFAQLAFSFLFVGEAFVTGPGAAFRKQMLPHLGRVLEAEHRRRLERLHQMVLHDSWQVVEAADAITQHRTLRTLVPLLDLDGARVPFEALMPRAGAESGAEAKPFHHTHSPSEVLAQILTHHEAGRPPAPAGADGVEDGAHDGIRGAAALVRIPDKLTSSSLFAYLCIEYQREFGTGVGGGQGTGLGTQCFHHAVQVFEACLLRSLQTFGDDTSLRSQNPGSLTPRLHRILRRVQQDQAAFVRASQSGEGSGSAGASASPGRGKGTNAYQQKAKMLFTSGNLFGLVERTAAVEALQELASHMHNLQAQWCAPAEGVEEPGRDAIFSQFYMETLPAVDDLKEHVFAEVSARLVPLASLAEKVAASKFDLTEIGTEHSAWVDVALTEFRNFSAKIQVVQMEEATIKILWQNATQNASHFILDGFSRVRKCTFQGRAAMALDLQIFSSGLKQICHPGVQPSLVLVDEYIKAFYTPEPEVAHWIRTHIGQYTKTQLVSLLTCMVDAGLVQRVNLPNLKAILE